MGPVDFLAELCYAFDLPDEQPFVFQFLDEHGVRETPGGNELVRGERTTFCATSESFSDEVLRYTTAETLNLYITSGLYDPADIDPKRGGRKQDNCRRALWCTLDLDGGFWYANKLAVPKDAAEKLLHALGDAELKATLNEHAEFLLDLASRVAQPPSMWVRSGYGHYALYFLADGEDVEAARQAAGAIRDAWIAAAGYKICDATIDAGTRIIRCPGTWNVKNPAKPRKATFTRRQDYPLYATAELLAAFGSKGAQGALGGAAAPQGAGTRSDALARPAQPIAPSAPRAEGASPFSPLGAAALPPDTTPSNPDWQQRVTKSTLAFITGAVPAVGDRNNSLFKVACDLAANQVPLDEALRLVSPAASAAGLPHYELKRTVESAFDRPRTPALPVAPPQPGDDPQLASLEWRCLGAALRDPIACATVCERLEPNDFLADAARDAFVALRRMADDGDVEAGVLRDDLAARGFTHAARGVVEAARIDLDLDDLPEWLQYLRDHTAERLLARECEQTLQALRAPHEFDLVGLHARNVEAIVGRAAPTEGASLLELSLAQFEAAERAFTKQGADVADTGLLTGVDVLDRCLGGLDLGTTSVIGAIPSHGKTAFGTQVALHLAARGVPTAFYTLELPRAVLARRIDATAIGVSVSDFKRGNLTPEQWERYGDYLAEQQRNPVPLEIFDHLNTHAELQASIARESHRRGVKFVVIDYLQLLTSGANERSREQELARIVQSLMRQAVALNLHMMWISQFHRPDTASDSAASRRKWRPNMHSFRETGAIEQSATYALGLWQDLDGDDDQIRTAEILVVKNRNGTTGTFEGVFDGPAQRFVDLTRKLRD